MKKIAFYSGVSGLILAAAAAYAAPQASAPVAAPQNAQARGTMKMDSDGNGGVTRAEAASAADVRFAKMDADGNGQIDQADRQARAITRFAKIDADKNGSLTQAEFVAADADRMTKRMAKGMAKGREHRGEQGTGSARGHGAGHGGVGKWGQADTNGDKAISRNEYEAAQQARFAAKDKDNNGVLTGDEMKNARREMRKLWNSKRESGGAGAG